MNVARVAWLRAGLGNARGGWRRRLAAAFCFAAIGASRRRMARRPKTPRRSIVAERRGASRSGGQTPVRGAWMCQKQKRRDDAFLPERRCFVQLGILFFHEFVTRWARGVSRSDGSFTPPIFSGASTRRRSSPIQIFQRAKPW